MVLTNMNNTSDSSKAFNASYDQNRTESRNRSDRGYAANNTVNRVKRPFDHSDNKWRGYEFSWAVYPDYWAPTWGPKPLLGYVRADSAFNARYAAFDRGLLPRNDTFQPEVILQERRYTRK